MGSGLCARGGNRVSPPVGRQRIDAPRIHHDRDYVASSADRQVGTDHTQRCFGSVDCLGFCAGIDFDARFSDVVCGCCCIGCDPFGIDRPSTEIGKATFCQRGCPHESEGGRNVGELALTTLVAGLATGLFAAYHFHRVAPFGLIANRHAMPLVSILVMPLALLSMLSIPFGFESVPLKLMDRASAPVIATGE